MPNPKARSSRAARMSAKSRAINYATPTLTLPHKGAGKWSRLVLAPGVERVVHRRFQLNLFLIALAKHQGEASGTCADPRRLGRDRHIVGHVGTVDDTGQLREPRVAQLIFADDRFEAAPSIDVAELDVWHVIGNGLFALGGRHDIGRWHEQELSLRVDKSLDQPGTGDPIDVRIRASDVFHDGPMYPPP